MSEMNYNATIQIEENNDYVVLTPGTYEFTVDRIEFGRHVPNPQNPGKLPECPKVTVFIHVDTPEGRAFLSNNFYLHTSTQGLITSYFRSLGMIPDGVKQYTMDWNGSIGKTGWVKTTTRLYNGVEYNNVDRFVKKAGQPAQTAAPAPNSRFSGML